MSDLQVLILDVETSSLDPRHQEILELSVMRLCGEQRTWRFRNTMPIDPRSTEVHGIRAEDLLGCQTFLQLALDVGAEITTADVVVGYNVDFDLRAIDAQFQRVGQKAPWQPGFCVVDLYRLWQVRERRGLQDAYRRFVGGEYDGAHGAEADVKATAAVLLGMGTVFDFTTHPQHPDAAAAYARLGDECNPRRPEHIGSKHLAWKDGRVVVNFGKHNGADLRRVPGGYLSWMLSSANIPSETAAVIEKSMAEKEQDFYTWVVQKYPPPVLAP